MEVWEAEDRRESIMRRKDISCLAADVVVVFCGGLQGEELFLTYLKGILEIWEETRKNKD